MIHEFVSWQSFALLFFFHLSTRFIILQRLHILGNRYLQFFFPQKHYWLLQYFFILFGFFLTHDFFLFSFFFVFMIFFFKIIFVDFIFNIEMVENLNLYFFYFVFLCGLWVCQGNWVASIYGFDEFFFYNCTCFFIVYFFSHIVEKIVL
jgi:hypothetical protein